MTPGTRIAVDAPWGVIADGCMLAIDVEKWAMPATTANPTGYRKSGLRVPTSSFYAMVLRGASPARIFLI